MGAILRFCTNRGIFTHEDFRINAGLTEDIRKACCIVSFRNSKTVWRKVMSTPRRFHFGMCEEVFKLWPCDITPCGPPPSPEIIEDSTPKRHNDRFSSDYSSEDGEEEIEKANSQRGAAWNSSGTVKVESPLTANKSSTARRIFLDIRPLPPSPQLSDHPQKRLQTLETAVVNSRRRPTASASASNKMPTSRLLNANVVRRFSTQFGVGGQNRSPSPQRRTYAEEYYNLPRSEGSQSSSGEKDSIPFRSSDSAQGHWGERGNRGNQGNQVSANAFWDINDALSFVAGKAEHGWFFGVKERKEFKKNSNFSFKVRFRCMHKKCSCGFIAKKYRKKLGWTISRVGTHSHEESVGTAHDKRERLNAYRQSVQEWIPLSAFPQDSPKQCHPTPPQLSSGKSSRQSIESGRESSQPLSPVLPNRMLNSADSEEINVLPSMHADVPLPPVLDEDSQRPSHISTPTDDPMVPFRAVVPVESPTDDFKTVVYPYVQSLPDNEDGKKVLKGIQYISECFGFRLVIRDSTYRLGSDEISQSRILRHARASCRNDDCSFRLRLKTTQLEKAVQQPNEPTSRFMYELVRFEGAHNHDPDPLPIFRTLPPELIREADEMHHSSYVDFSLVVRYLEDKYGFIINSEGLKKRLRWLASKRHPKEMDCENLKQALITLRNRDIGSVSYVSKRADNAMDCVCWAFSSWLRDYERYGIAPGVCIDCKAEANDFSLPLVTINARTNDGRVCTVFMGFLADETEQSFKWLLNCFKNSINCDPIMIAMDQQAACMNSCRIVFRFSYITLDDWHVNQNQLKNVWNWLCKIDRKVWKEEMHDDLFLMRKSSTPQSFEARRNAFEAKYFLPFTQTFPKWYCTLYRTYAKIMVDCYNKSACDPRFLFQGSGYTESSNAAYRRFVLVKKVPIWDIPSEMHRVSINRGKIREAERRKPFRVMRDKLSGAQLGMHAEVIEKLVSTYTPYALKQFYNHSMVKASNYLVTAVRLERCRDGDLDSLNPSFVSTRMGSTQQANNAQGASQGGHQVVFKVIWNGAAHLPRSNHFSDVIDRRRRPPTICHGSQGDRRTSPQPLPFPTQISDTSHQIASSQFRIPARRNGGPPMHPLPTAWRVSRFQRGASHRQRDQPSQAFPGPSSSSAAPRHLLPQRLPSLGAAEHITNYVNGNREDSVTLTPVQEYYARIANEQRPSAQYEVVLAVRGESQKYKCTCSWSRTTGIPCAHVVRVATVFTEKANERPNIAVVLGRRIALEELFHPYWSRHEADWTTEQIVAHRERVITRWRRSVGEAGQVLEGVVEDALQRDRAREEMELGRVELDTAGLAPNALEERERRKEMIREASWATGKSLFDQMHRIASNLGPEAVLQTTNYLRQGLQSLCDGQPPVAAASAHHIASFEIGRNGLRANNFMQNPNRGRTRNRGVRRRIRGALEGRRDLRRTPRQEAGVGERSLTQGNSTHNRN